MASATNHKKKESGFVDTVRVIFHALLITLVTAGVLWSRRTA